MNELAALRDVEALGVVLGDFQCRRRNVGALDERLRGFRRDRDRDRTAADADVEHGDELLGHQETDAVADVFQRFLDDVLGFRARNEHLVVHRELAAVEPGKPEDIGQRLAGRAFLAQRVELVAPGPSKGTPRRAPRSTLFLRPSRSPGAVGHRFAATRYSLRARRYRALDSARSSAAGNWSP